MQEDSRCFGAGMLTAQLQRASTKLSQACNVHYSVRSSRPGCDPQPHWRARLSGQTFRRWTRGAMEPHGAGAGPDGTRGDLGRGWGAVEAGIWLSWLRAHPGLLQVAA